MRAPPPTPTLFPYTTLFRSRDRGNDGDTHARAVHADQRSDPCYGARHAGHPGCPCDGDAREALTTASARSEEHTSELQSPYDLVCRLLREKKNSNLLLPRA